MPAEGGWIGAVAILRAITSVGRGIKAGGLWIRDAVGMVKKVRTLWAAHEAKAPERPTFESGGLRWARHEVTGWWQPYCNVCWTKERQFFPLDSINSQLGHMLLCPSCNREKYMEKNEIDAHRDEAKKYLPE